MTDEKSGIPSLGAFEMHVLMAIRKCGREAYGVPIARVIAEATGREPSFGALYTTLDRLEAKKWLASRLGEATAERGGRRKKYFELTALGQRVLTENLMALDRLQAADIGPMGGVTAGGKP